MPRRPAPPAPFPDDTFAAVVAPPPRVDEPEGLYADTPRCFAPITPPLTVAELMRPGPARRLAEHDIAAAAELIGCDVPAIKAVLDVEAAGSGFRRTEFPTIKPEPHVFSRETGGRFDETHPKISEPSFAKAKRLWRQDPEWMLREMAELDQGAALRSTSFGLGQVMGFNHALAGADSPQQLLDEAKASEAEQLGHMMLFIKATRLDGHLRAHDWTRFARGYNGPGFRQLDYDGKLARAYQKHAGAPSWVVIELGAEGAAVRRLQQALTAAGFPVGDDGHFGPATEVAVRAFQQESGLAVDGVVGARTWEALKLRRAVEPEPDIAPKPPAPADDMLDELTKVGGVVSVFGISMDGWIGIGFGAVALGAVAFYFIRKVRRK